MPIFSTNFRFENLRKLLFATGGNRTLCPILHQWMVRPSGCVDPGHHQITICSHLTWKESCHKRTEFSCPSQDIHATVFKIENQQGPTRGALLTIL